VFCSIGLCKFSGQGEQSFVLVGTGRELGLNPRSHSGGIIHCYKITNGRLELVHKTPVDDIPGAICPFQGRVLISVGKLLRIYDIGKKKMLRKCENKVKWIACILLKTVAVIVRLFEFNWWARVFLLFDHTLQFRAVSSEFLSNHQRLYQDRTQYIRM